MKASERYYELTKRKYVFNIMPIENVPSVLENGIVCFNKMQQIKHTSIALDTVQERRSKVEIPNGKALHQYANLYFSYRNPMLYKRKDQAEDLCILAISASVLDLEGCIVSDRNAAAALVRFYPALEGMEYLDFENIHRKYWAVGDLNTQRTLRNIKCAEILVPEFVIPEFIDGAYVVNERSKLALIGMGFLKDIVVNESVFFR